MVTSEIRNIRRGEVCFTHPAPVAVSECHPAVSVAFAPRVGVPPISASLTALRGDLRERLGIAKLRAYATVAGARTALSLLLA